MKKDDTKKNKEEVASEKATKKGVNKKLIAIIAAVVAVIVAVVVVVVILTSGNAKVPGKDNEDALAKDADSLSIIEEGDEVKMEDVTAITGATSPDGTVTDDKGIIDKEGHKIYSTGQKDDKGLIIYTTGKVDSKGNVLYTKNQTNTFDKLVYYTGKYDSNGKLILTPSTEKPDYTSNEKPDPYKPENSTTVTVPLKSDSGAKITGMERKYIKFFGGKAVDNFNAVAPCEDGGYVVSVYSNSYDGDLEGVSKEWGGHTAIIKYDAEGNVLWRYDLGGDSEVWFNDVTELKDGTIVAAGFTMSEGEPAKTSSAHSAMIVRLKKNGDHMWTYIFPGSTDYTGEFIQCVEATPDGGFVVGGKAESNSGFFKGGANERKAFLFKFDKNCNIEWRRILSGSMSNNFTAVDVNDKGDIFATCVTYSNDGDFAGLSYDAKLGAANTVLVKLNKNGNLEWKHYLQSSGNSEYNAVVATDDGGCAVAGSFVANKKADGIYNSTLGKSDGYVIRYNKDGDVHWARIVGGQNEDYINGITKIEGGFVIVGNTKSSDGDFRGEVLGGGNDGFIMYLDEKGQTCDKFVFEGKTDDVAKSVCTLDSGEVAVAGSTTSQDGFFHGSNAGKQFNGYVARFATKY
ncbi:MAG: hypothetical protein J6L62_05320 [Clostridia bacterium]|nr:hypothetical protein [Clostridia bacterium]